MFEGIGGSLLDFAGSLISGSSNRKEARRSRQQSQAMFDAQMDQSVQRRVADANKAGIHPLFAMGASVGASPTMVHSGSATTGSAVGDAVSRLGQRLAEAQIANAAADARKSESEAALADSKTATLTSRLASSGRDGVRTYPYPVSDNETMNMAYGPGWIEEPAFIPAHGNNPGIRAGVTPGTVDVKLPDGRTVNLLNQDLGLDEIGQFDYLMQRARHKVTDFLSTIGPRVSDGAIIQGIKDIFRGVSKASKQPRIRN